MPLRAPLSLDPLIGFGKSSLTIESHKQGRAMPGQGRDSHPLQAARAETDLVATVLNELDVWKGMRISRGRIAVLDLVPGRLWWAWMDLTPNQTVMSGRL